MSATTIRPVWPIAVICRRCLSGSFGSAGDVHDCGVAEAISMNYAGTAYWGTIWSAGKVESTRSKHEL